MKSDSGARIRAVVPANTFSLIGIYYFLATLGSAYLVVASATGQFELNFWQAISPLWLPVVCVGLAIAVITTVVVVFFAVVYALSLISSIPRRVRTALRGLRPKPKGEPTYRREPAKRFHHLTGGPLPDRE
jgi:hypothetical protein